MMDPIQMTTKTEDNNFSQYYEKWHYQLQLLLPQLIGASRESRNHDQLKHLVSKLTSHHKEYYTEKWAAAHVDVLPFFSPSWWTPLENAYSWFTGWKPSTVFRLVGSGGGSLTDLSEEQVKKIEQLRLKIRYEEARIERELERQQVGLADRKVVDLGRISSRRTEDGGVLVGDAVGSPTSGIMDVALTSISCGLERLMKSADCVRLKTLKGLLDVLTPLQCVEFLAAVSLLQIQLRQWGQLRRHHDMNRGSKIRGIVGLVGITP